MNWTWLFFSFEGRINRAKWWLALLVFVVLALLISFAILPLLGLSVMTMGATAGGAAVSLIITLIFAYPGTAVLVKRIKDRDRPLWLVAVFWAPTVLSILGQLAGVTASVQDIGGQQVLMPTAFGWVVNLLSFVVGIWALIELGCLRGTKGPNQHGPDPLGASA
jgi:uncharacterized membrane protein YhaH (DUF805 family)